MQPSSAPDRPIGLVIFPRFTALDIVGPCEVLSRLGAHRGYRTIWLAETLDPVRSDRGMTVVPEAMFADAPPLAILVVPGGPGQFGQMENEALLGLIRRTAAAGAIVASVCTGSLLLAAAGLLQGKRATTHWLARDALGALGAIPTEDRVVWEGDIVTAAGVSSGIDLAIALAARLEGDVWAQAIQLGIEYDPQPPFDAGSPSKAPSDVVETLRAGAREFLL